MLNTLILTFTIGSSVIAFEKIDGVMVNQSCEKKCQAYTQAIKYKDVKVPVSDLEGGKNPRSVWCKKILNGVVVIGRTPSKNQQSFCQFEDESYLKL